MENSNATGPSPITSKVKIAGKKYILQHPGMRLWIRWQSEATETSGKGKHSINLEIVLDRGFEFVIIPDGHNYKPTLDTSSPSEVQEWLKVLPGFLQNGKVISDPSIPEQSPGGGKTTGAG